MRNIEFRGRTPDGEWVYGGVFGFTNIYRYEGLEVVPCKVVLGTIGQYTGGRDKNKVRIFEDDIVEFEVVVDDICYSEYGRVVFQDYGYKVITSEGIDYTFSRVKSMEVVSNTHDNPDLFN